MNEKIDLAPIVLFVYNRPTHTKRTIDALKKNVLADKSVLYIYADGAKSDASVDELNKISEVGQLIGGVNFFREVHLIKASRNKGLAASIVEGVSNVIAIHGKAIILEDDIVTSPFFLQYMNDALALYNNDERVYHISAYMFPVHGKLPTTFFYKQTSCWGWGTWENRWKKLNTSAPAILQQLVDKEDLRNTDIDGTGQFIRQLEDNISGKIKTWAVLWHFSVWLEGGLCLHPNISIVTNIGNDGSGSNSKDSPIFDVKLAKDYMPLKLVEVVDFKPVYSYLKNFYNLSKKRSPVAYASDKLRGYMPSFVKRALKLAVDRGFRAEEQQKTRIKNLPRYTMAKVVFNNVDITIVDNASYLFIKKEIFDQQIYKFDTTKKKPYIIDCGANIGLGIIYFKQLFPEAEILAFEPDAAIFNVLEKNVQAFGLDNVTLIKKACWNQDTILQFYSEGADGGRAAKDFDQSKIIEVQAIKLSHFLNKKVDFLKIDIEGAETEVLGDIADKLYHVERIFVEFHSFVQKEQMLPEIISILKNAGFRLHISSPGLISLSPFTKLNVYANMDNQINIYGFRPNSF